MQISQQFFKPLLTAVIRRLKGGNPERTYVANLVYVDGFVNAAAHVIVSRGYVGNLRSGNVECLCRRCTRRRMRQESVRKRGERRVLVARHNDVAVYFVRQDEHSVLQADVAHTAQFVSSPRTSGRVMGVAQQEELDLRVGGTPLEVVKINCISAVGVNQLVVFHHTAVVPYGRKEAVVNRRLHKHLVTGNGHRLDDSRHGRHHSGSIYHPLAPHAPAVAAVKPVDYGLVIRVGNMLVTEHSVVNPPAQSLNNTRRSAEIHVRNPHWQSAFHLSAVPLLAVSAAAVYNLVEIKFCHNIIIISST